MWPFRSEPWISTRMTIGGGVTTRWCVSHRQTKIWLQIDVYSLMLWPHAFHPLFLWLPLVASPSSPGLHWGTDIKGMTWTTRTWNSHPLAANCACACKSIAETLIRQKQQGSVRCARSHDNLKWNPVTCTRLIYANPLICGECTLRDTREPVPQRDLISSSWAVDPGSRQTHTVAGQAYGEGDPLELQGETGGYNHLYTAGGRAVRL